MRALRTVVLEKRAEVALDALFAEYTEIEAVYDGIVWRLCRNPESGGMRIHQTNGQDYFIVRVEGWVKTPSLVLLYRFTDSEVVVLGAHGVNE